jgi:glutamine amidotransferase
MLCVVPPNVLPSREKLENSALNNPDGFGFAIVIPRENRILVEHTMNADKSINNFLEMRAKYPEGYALWHARYATHGSVDESNCHPFWVGKNKDTILAHNGVLPTLEKVEDKRSDTRIFAEDILEKIGGAPALDNDQMWNMLEDFSSGSKICVLTTDPNAKYQMYLMHADKGNYDTSGVWWSNEGWKLSSYGRYVTSAYGYYDGFYDFNTKYTQKQPQVIGGQSSAWSDDSFYSRPNSIPCVACEALLDIEVLETGTGLCTNCKTCQMCDMNEMSCMCFRQSNHPAGTQQVKESDV